MTKGQVLLEGSKNTYSKTRNFEFGPCRCIHRWNVQDEPLEIVIHGNLSQNISRWRDDDRTSGFDILCSTHVGRYRGNFALFKRDTFRSMVQWFNDYWILKCTPSFPLTFATFTPFPFILFRIGRHSAYYTRFAMHWRSNDPRTSLISLWYIWKKNKNHTLRIFQKFVPPNATSRLELSTSTEFLNSIPCSALTTFKCNFPARKTPLVHRIGGGVDYKLVL